MKSLIKKILKKISHLISPSTSIQNNFVDGNQLLIQKGFLKVGKDSDIQKLNIHSHKFNEEFPNVVIGDDCQILGQIELQSPNAKVIIGNRVYIGPNTKIFCREKVEIQDDILISWGCSIIDTNFHSIYFADRSNDVIDGKKGWTHLKWKGVLDKPVLIKSKSWIGFDSIITKGVVIEEGCVVACGSVVTKSTTRYTLVGGNPALLIKIIN